jgi:hypothetical protein
MAIVPEMYRTADYSLMWLDFQKVFRVLKVPWKVKEVGLQGIIRGSGFKGSESLNIEICSPA